ncbi:MAG: hypothetical protein HYY20_02495 [Candidatus Tectomicrobia bacterium]|uniref:Methyltransferase domain-containing protein n=1 Tax=Tectimicrobiota bacterium TaxID=2528274 RepID=A0A932CM60_UNCTE|nr:hypothetical protein [Candidatus Tectomicrobia bacterium]
MHDGLKDRKPFTLFRHMAGRVLFVAVGTGMDIRHFPPDREIIAIDISERMLERASARRKGYRGALLTPLPDGEFDGGDTRLASFA